MDVSVGAFSDPEGLEGLAHFLGTKIGFVILGMLQFLSADWLQAQRSEH